MFKEMFHQCATPLLKWWKSECRHRHMSRYGIVAHRGIMADAPIWEFLGGSRPVDILFEQLERNGFRNSDNSPPLRSYEAPIQLKVGGKNIPENAGKLLFNKNGWVFEKVDGNVRTCIIVTSPEEDVSSFRCGKVGLLALELTDEKRGVTTAKVIAETILPEFMVSHYEPDGKYHPGGDRTKEVVAYFVQVLGVYGSPPSRQTKSAKPPKFGGIEL